MNLTSPIRNGFLAILAGIAISGTASADVILYQDDFSGSSGTELNGTTPDITIGSNVWVSGTAWRGNGVYSIAPSTAAAGTYALLAFTPEAGNVYTLSATVSITSEQGLMMFFGNSTTAVFNVADGNLDNVAGMRFDSWGSANLRYAFTDRDADGEFNYGPGTPAQPGVAQIVLDTNDPTWTASFYYGGTLFGTSTGIIPGSISNIGFSAQWYDGFPPVGGVDNLTLSVAAVPEPAVGSLLLVGIGAAALLRKRRTRTGLDE